EEQVLSQLPLICRWGDGNPLTRRIIRAPRKSRSRFLSLPAPSWITTGPAEQPFDFCRHLRHLCEDMVKPSEVLRPVHVSRLLFSATQARSNRAHGLQARVAPLRFRNGELTSRRRGILYQVQRYFLDNREMLYVVSFCLPRFLDQDFDDKLITLFHELYHIS